ncbi:MAG: FAD-dependent oxidoreductase [Gemmatimonadaceae bacterium]
MPKPVILAVDDDHEVLGAVERDLRQRYRQKYRIVSSSSGQEALDTVRELKRRGAPVALFLADQRMPGMSGTELLTELRQLYPETKRTLLTAYADTEAAIAAINEVGLDHYLMKPWDPPEESLYPVIDDLLTDWSANATVPFDGVRVVGSRWSPQSFTTRDFLARNQVPYQWVDIDKDAEMRALITSDGAATPRLPVVLLPDGTMLVAPSNGELASRVGLQTVAVRPFYDLVIIGAGPAGLACAVYGASEGLKVLLIEQNAPGGQAGTSSMIENYLGFPNGVTGADLARRAAMQARRFGTEVLVSNAVTGLRREDPYRIVELSNGTEVACHALMLSSGMAAVKELESPGVGKLIGAGVYYGAALSEAAMYRGQHVYVLGGANSAGQGALFFSRYADHVTLIVRKPTLTSQMSQYLIDRIAQTENICVIGDSEITAVHGEDHLERIDVLNAKTGVTTTVPAVALFIFIGVAPRTEPFRPLVATDDKGFILTGADAREAARGWGLAREPMLFETSVPGIFAAGDVRANANRRIAAAVGEGSAAIFSVHQYLRSV